MCRWCERSPSADQLTAGLSLPARREFSADPDAASGGGPGATPAPTIVFRNGMIRTMVVGRDRVDALAISGTTILATGSAEEVKAQAGPKASVVDLQGQSASHPAAHRNRGDDTGRPVDRSRLLRQSAPGRRSVDGRSGRRLDPPPDLRHVRQWPRRGGQHCGLPAGRHRPGRRHPARRRPLRPRSRRRAERSDVRAAGVAAISRPRGSASDPRAHRHGVDGVWQRGGSGR